MERTRKTKSSFIQTGRNTMGLLKKVFRRDSGECFMHLENTTSATGKLTRNDGVAEGQGQYFSNDNSRYIGEFRNGLIEGKGLLYSFDQNCYKGAFKGGKKSGIGELITKKGKILDQVWDNGNLVKESPNFEKSNIMMGLKSHQQLKIEAEQEKRNEQGEQKKIEKIAEKLLKVGSSDEFNSMVSGTNNVGPETLSLIDFTDKLKLFIADLNIADVRKWTVQDVGHLLDYFGLGSLKASFLENKIDGHALLKLNESDYRDIGITQFTQKVLIRDLIKKLVSLSNSQRKKNYAQRRFSPGRLLRDPLAGKNVKATEMKNDISNEAIEHSSKSESNKDQLKEMEKNNKMSSSKASQFKLNHIRGIAFRKLSAGSLRNRLKSFTSISRFQNNDDPNHIIIEESSLDKSSSSSSHGKGAKSEPNKSPNSSILNEEGQEIQSLSRQRTSKSIESNKHQGKNLDDSFEFLRRRGTESKKKDSRDYFQGDAETSPILNIATSSSFQRKQSFNEKPAGYNKNLLSSSHKLPKHLVKKISQGSSEQMTSKSSPNLLCKSHNGLILGRSRSFTRVHEEVQSQEKRYRSFSPSYNEHACTFSNMSNLAMIPDDEVKRDYLFSDESLSSSGESSDSEKSKRNKDHWKLDILNDVGAELKNFLVDKDDIQFDKKIGDGVYGSVWKGTYHGTDVAMKVFLPNRLRAGSRQQFLEEAEILCSLRSPYIVLFMGVCIKHPQYLLLTEYMEDGSLYEILHKQQNIEDKSTIMHNLNVKFKIIESIAHGMNYLHEKRVLHCDLKSSNILVN